MFHNGWVIKLTFSHCLANTWKNQGLLCNTSKGLKFDEEAVSSDVLKLQISQFALYGNYSSMYLHTNTNPACLNSNGTQVHLKKMTKKHFYDSCLFRELLFWFLNFGIMIT